MQAIGAVPCMGPAPPQGLVHRRAKNAWHKLRIQTRDGPCRQAGCERQRNDATSGRPGDQIETLAEWHGRFAGTIEFNFNLLEYFGREIAPSTAAIEREDRKPWSRASTSARMAAGNFKLCRRHGDGLVRATAAFVSTQDLATASAACIGGR